MGATATTATTADPREARYSDFGVDLEKLTLNKTYAPSMPIIKIRHILVEVVGVLVIMLRQVRQILLLPIVRVTFKT